MMNIAPSSKNACSVVTPASLFYAVDPFLASCIHGV